MMNPDQFDRLMRQVGRAKGFPARAYTSAASDLDEQDLCWRLFHISEVVRQCKPVPMLLTYYIELKDELLRTALKKMNVTQFRKFTALLREVTDDDF